MENKNNILRDLIIEKLGQLERGELENSPSGKLLAKKFSENEEFVKIYNDYKKYHGEIKIMKKEKWSEGERQRY